MSILKRMKTLRGKLFRNGGSQAVRLPHECRFPDGQKEVTVRREGRRVVLEAADEWPERFSACLGAWHEDIPRPPQRPIRQVGNPFR
jgi:virulence-associated protein VagC